MNFKKQRKELAKTKASYCVVNTISNNTITTEIENDIETFVDNYKKSIVLSGNGHVAGLQINYSGNFDGKINVPESWLTDYGQDTILSFDMGATGLDLTREYNLIDYNGNLSIKKMILVTYDAKQLISTINPEIENVKYENSSSVWNTETRTYNQIGDITSTRNYVKNNLHINPTFDAKEQKFYKILDGEYKETNSKGSSRTLPDKKRQNKFKMKARKFNGNY